MSTLAQPVARLPGDFFGGIRTRAASWYDAIIDIMIAEPGISNDEIARQLSRHPNTIATIVNSDIFRERFIIRRQQFIDAQNHKLISKLQKVAEQSLDITSEVLEKQRDKVPLKMLHEITTGTLDRLGYTPSRSDSAPGVNVQILNNPQAVAVAQASPAGLQKARDYLTTLQSLPRSEEAPVVVDEGEG